MSNKYISEHHIKRYKKTKMNFDELLAVNNCKVVSIFFKFAHPFLLLYFLCYPYRQFFMFFFSDVLSGLFYVLLSLVMVPTV